ncbi:hypothetical protein ACI2LO_16890 [Streptomyces sp. NPDC033754]|uniref:hypothetical protein n=1 Tax=unclassified Streptomyces TaxID=2593676 RepID=UPI0033E54949
MNRNPRRILGAVTGAALLLGGAFAAQAVADSGPKPAPKVVTPGDAAAKPASKPASKPAVVKPASKPAVVKPAPKPAVVKPASKPAVAKPVPAENAPRVIAPGTGAKK